MLNDHFGFPNIDNSNKIAIPLGREGMIRDAKNYYALLKDAEKELYPNCKTSTKLSCIIRLFHLKVINGWSNKSLTMLLILLKEMLPKVKILSNTL